MITLALVASLSLLIMRLPGHKDQPVGLLIADAPMRPPFGLLYFATFFL